MYDYVDDTLSASDVLEVEAHLEGCDPCTAIVQDLRTLIAGLRDLPKNVPVDSPTLSTLQHRLGQPDEFGSTLVETIGIRDTGTATTMGFDNICGESLTSIRRRVAQLLFFAAMSGWLTWASTRSGPTQPAQEST